MSRSRNFLKAGLVQAKTELRINFLTPSFLAIMSGPLVTIGILWLVFRDIEWHGFGDASSSYSLGGVLGLAGAMAAFQIISEMNVERTDGTLLRLRMLPNGLNGWVFGKTLSVGVQTLWTALVMTVGVLLIAPRLEIDTVARYFALAVVIVITYLVMLPFGIMAGTITKGSIGLLIAMAVYMIIFALSGALLPISIYPTVLQWIMVATPFYWSAHVARWALLGPEFGVLEFGGAFQPLLGLGVLLAWAIIGYLLAPRVLRRGIRRETVGSLTAAFDKQMRQGYA